MILSVCRSLSLARLLTTNQETSLLNLLLVSYVHPLPPSFHSSPSLFTLLPFHSSPTYISFRKSSILFPASLITTLFSVPLDTNITTSYTTTY